MKLFYYTLLEKIGYYFIKRHINNFIRACFYFKIGYNNFDWDNGYLHELTLYKLKRMQKFFLNEGYHCETCSNYKLKMKTLALTIKLLEKYKKDEHRFLDIHDKKWGPLQVRWEPYFTYARPNIITREDLEQERKEFREAYATDERRNARFLQTAYKIIGKHSNLWWD